MEGGGFRCPQDFVPAADGDRSLTSDPDTELWLIKAPANFTPESFNSRRFSLSGSKLQKVKDGGVKKSYRVVSSPCAALPLRALLSPSEDTFTAAAPVQGVITLAEAPGDHTAVHSVPDRPPLSLPRGLKQRYCPFGAIAPRVGKVSSGNSKLSAGTKKKKKSKKRRQEAAQDMDA